MPALSKYQFGITLVELIISMVIISVAVTGVFSVMNVSVSHSADPLIYQQAVAIAEAYMEEILLQAYVDPDGTNTGETRATFDNVYDYNGLSNTGARDQQGNVMSGLSEYTVAVAVSSEMTFAGSVAGREVTVTVSRPSMTSLSLVGYKFNY